MRQLATDLGLAANTVARAYRELEQAGLVETRGRAGTVITARAARTPARSPRGGPAVRGDGPKNLGLPPGQALELVKAALLPPG